MRKIASLPGLLFLLAAVPAGAQTKISGTLKCEKPEPMYTIEVGDRPGHVMALEKLTCSYTKPLEIGETKTKDGYSIASVDATSARTAGNGSHVMNMENGEKTFVSFHDTASVKDGKPGPSHGMWSFTGGTGKLKGIKGKGTFTATSSDDGTSTVEVEGEYQLGSGSAGTKK